MTEDHNSMIRRRAAAKDPRNHMDAQRLSDMPSKANKERDFCSLSDGRKLAYIMQGPIDMDGSGAASLPHVFMLPCMFCTANDVIFEAPPKQYIWICVDRPGYGDSSCPVDYTTYSYRHFATDILELADHLQVTDFYVAGHSSGGPCALACAAHLGHERVKGVAAIATDAEYTKEGAPLEVHWRNAVSNAFYHATCHYCLVGGRVCGPIKKRLPGYKVDYRLEHEPYDFRVDSITQPTLVAFGDKDTWARPHAEFVKEQIGEGAELMVMPSVNHMTIIQQVHIDAIISKILTMAAQTREGKAD